MKLIKMTKLTVIPAILILLLGLFPVEIQARERFEEKFEKTIVLARDGEVILENISGNIEIKSWSKGEVRIDALKISRASTYSQAEENAKRVEIRINKEGKTLRIKTEYPQGRLIRRRKSMNVSVSYHLSIPDKASVRIHSVSGNVDLEEIGGSVKTNVISGNVKIAGAGKGVDCDTTSGRLEIRDVSGDAYLKTVSGRISANRVRGSVKAEVVSGRIELIDISGAKVVEGKALSGSVTYEGEIDPNGRYTVHSHSGNVKMILPSGSSFELEAKTFSGRIQSDFDITISGRISKRELRGVVNKGGAFVKISTFSGNVSLIKK